MNIFIWIIFIKIRITYQLCDNYVKYVIYLRRWKIVYIIYFFYLFIIYDL